MVPGRNSCAPGLVSSYASSQKILLRLDNKANFKIKILFRFAQASGQSRTFVPFCPNHYSVGYFIIYPITLLLLGFILAFKKIRHTKINGVIPRWAIS